MVTKSSFLRPGRRCLSPFLLPPLTLSLITARYRCTNTLLRPMSLCVELYIQKHKNLSLLSGFVSSFPLLVIVRADLSID
ncbi:hypothetical protein EV363DRAFT_878728 [Boletus edulis]|nr:hypothetical protein EV363DRAFT_878728 [Boletus edulis]